MNAPQLKKHVQAYQHATELPTTAHLQSHQVGSRRALQCQLLIAVPPAQTGEREPETTFVDLAEPTFVTRLQKVIYQALPGISFSGCGEARARGPGISVTLPAPGGQQRTLKEQITSLHGMHGKLALGHLDLRKGCSVCTLFQVEQLQAFFQLSSSCSPMLQCGVNCAER